MTEIPDAPHAVLGNERTYPEVSNQILANLATQLITVSLTALTLLGGLFVFVKDKDNMQPIFALIGLLAMGAFVFSSILGAQGITSIANNSNNPMRPINREYLSNQALMLYAAIGLSALSLFFVKPNTDGSEIERLFVRQKKIEARLAATETSFRQTNAALQLKTKEIQELRVQLNRIQSENGK